MLNGGGQEVANYRLRMSIIRARVALEAALRWDQNVRWGGAPFTSCSKETWRVMGSSVESLPTIPNRNISPHEVVSRVAVGVNLDSTRFDYPFGLAAVR